MPFVERSAGVILAAFAQKQPGVAEEFVTPLTYDIAADMPGGSVNTITLEEEIRASAIGTKLFSARANGNVLSILFDTLPLPAGDKTILDGDTTGPAGGLLAAHDNAVTPRPEFNQTTKITTTTDGVAKTIQTIAVADDTVIEIVAEIVGRRTDAADRIGGIVRATVFREAGGGVVVEGTSQDFSASKSDYDINIVGSGNNALIQVTGETAHTLNWRSVSRVNSVA